MTMPINLVIPVWSRIRISLFDDQIIHIEP